MKFLSKLGILFYVTLTMFVGCIMLLFVLNLISLRDISFTLYVIYYDPTMRGVFGLIAVILLLKNYIYSRALAVYQQRGKTIAFDNPSGRVSVSLSAMEDLIHKVIGRVMEVKEVRSTISAGKKGLTVETQLMLNADVNIPELTSKLQELIKKKIQSTIGIEEDVIVKIDVVKIIAGGKKRSRNRDDDDDDQNPEPQVPFQGYRA